MTRYKATNILSGPLRMRRDTGEFIVFEPGKSIEVRDVGFIGGHPSIKIEELVDVQMVRKQTKRSK